MKTKTFIIGTNPKGKRDDIKVKIDDKYNEVSETHCKLTLKGTDFYIEDLNSATGTYVNGEKILEKTNVDFDDEITLGFNNKLSLNNKLIKFVYDENKKKKSKQIFTVTAIGFVILKILFHIFRKL